MEHVKNSGILRIAFDVIAGIVALIGVNKFLGSSVDLPITILASALVIGATAMVVHQNTRLLKFIEEQ